MAHTKQQGAANRHVRHPGRRRGVKRSAGSVVHPGTIVIRQLGTKFHPGRNTGMGKDFTIFSLIEGVVAFRDMAGGHKGQKFVDITPAAPVTAEK